MFSLLLLSTFGNRKLSRPFRRADFLSRDRVAYAARQSVFVHRTSFVLQFIAELEAASTLAPKRINSASGVPIAIMNWPDTGRP